jgi:hemoglobin
MVETQISEGQIDELVDRFYAKVRRDDEIGPIFNNAVENWDAHLALLKDFWSTVLLTTARYKGNPLATHFSLPIEMQNFDRWLGLFQETAAEVMSPDQVERVVTKAQFIARNMKRVLATREA